MVDLDPIVGHEQGGQRPALIISADTMNRSPADLVIVAPITGTDRNIPSHVKVTAPEGGLSEASVILLGAVSPATMVQVEDRLKLILDLP